MKHKTADVKKKPNNIDQVMDIEELIELNLFKKELDEFG